MSDADKTPDVAGLLKSVLLPGNESLRAFADKLKHDAESTEWTRSLNRIEGLAFLSLVFAGSLFLAFFIYRQSVIRGVVDLLGLPSLVTLTLAIVLLYLKMLMEIIKKIDQGESIMLFLIQGGEKIPPWTSLLLGGTFLAASIGMVLALNMTLSQLLLFLVISLAVVGSFIVGVACFARLAIFHGN